MFETINSQVQQNQERFAAALNEQVTRLGTLYEEIDHLEERGLTVAKSAIDDSTKLVKDSIDSVQAATKTITKSMKEVSPIKPVVDMPEWMPDLGTFRKLAEEQLDRVKAMTEEVEKMEHDGTVRAGEAVVEYHRLVKEALTYGVKLSSAWRRLAMESTKRAAELIVPPATKE